MSCNTVESATRRVPKRATEDLHRQQRSFDVYATPACPKGVVLDEYMITIVPASNLRLTVPYYSTHRSSGVELVKMNTTNAGRTRP